MFWVKTLFSLLRIVALSLGKGFAAVSWTGVNVAGFDFGCAVDVCCSYI